MDNKVTTPKTERRSLITDSINALADRESVIFTSKEAKVSSVRQSVFRLQKKTEKRFIASEKGVNGIKVTRVC